MLEPQQSDHDAQLDVAKKEGQSRHSWEGMTKLEDRHFTRATGRKYEKNIGHIEKLEASMTWLV